jgi:hypothetical protein
MKARNLFISLSIVMAALVAGGCAQDGAGNPITTSAVSADKSLSQSAAKVDPACATLASQIDGLRKEPTVENLEKAAAGKTKTVQVKRTALAKQAELNKANADFQAKCGPALPKAQTAQAAVPASAQTVAAQGDTAKKAATTPAAATAPQPAATAAKDAVKDAAKKAQ